MRFLAAAAVLFLLLAASPTCAQSDFDGLPLKPGDTVYVTLPSGVEVSGPLTSIARDRLSIDGHMFTPEPNLRIDRRGDSVWSGVAWGLGISTMLGAGLIGCCPRYMVGPWVLSAAIGAAADGLNVGRTPIFRGTSSTGASRTRVVPLAERHSRGVALAISF